MKTIIYFVSEDWYFCSHRLPIARKALIKGFKVVVVTKVSKYGSVIESEGFELAPIEIQRGGWNLSSEFKTILALYAYYKKYKPDIVYTHYEHDLNIDHYYTFYSTFVASRPNNDFKIRKLLSFEIPSSTDWSIGNKSFIPNYFVDIKKYKSQKEKLLKFYKHEMRLPPHSRSIKNLNSLSIFRGGIVGLDYAEAFLVNRIID